MAMRFERTRPFFILTRPIHGTTTFSSSLDDDSTLISTTISIIRHHRTRTRWNHLLSLHPAGFSPSQSSTIILNLRNNPRLALRFFVNRRLCPHHLTPFAAIIHTLARSRLKPQALSLLLVATRSLDNDLIFETLVKTYRTFDSAPFVFDLLIRAYLESKKLDRALHVARLLISRQIYPLLATSNSIIRSVAKANGSDAGLQIYRELFAGKVTPNIQTFNTLLLACYRDGRLDSAEIRGEIEKFGCDPNAFTYSILMAGFCDEGRIEKAREVWEEMAEKQINYDIVAFNTMIGGYCDVGEVMRAEELFQEMGVSGIEATGTTFEHLIRGHCRAGDVDSAVMVFDDMRRRGHRAESATVDEVIEEMCVRGRVEEGLGVLRSEMKRKDGGFCASRTSYEVLIGGFCEKGEVEEALKLQAEMAGRGFESGEKVFNAFIEAYRKQGDVEKAEKLKDEMLEMFAKKEGD